MNITNEDVTAYIDGLYAPLTVELGELRAFGESQSIPILSKETEMVIGNLMRMKQPKTVLEIGTAIGYSAACFATICDCHVTTIELQEKMAQLAEKNLEKLGLSDRVNVLRGDARTVLETLTGPFDFVFIDAAKSHYRVFWDKIINDCAEEAVILCDNVLLKGITASDDYLTSRRDRTSMMRMRDFLRHIHQLEGVSTSVLSVGDGLSISVLERRT